MPIPVRYRLWEGEAVLDAVDDIAEDIGNRIDDNISECGPDSVGWLNMVVAQMCCLSAVSNLYGGMTCQYDRVRKWRSQVIQILEEFYASECEPGSLQKDRAHVVSVIDSLFEGVDKSTRESAQEEWLPDGSS